MKIVEVARAARVLPLLVLVVLACGLSGQAVMAQETSSNVRGQVLASNGQPVAGAEVSIRHMPSGTVARSETGSTGQFFATGLRVGGPYEIRVVSDDYRTVVRDDVFLRPGSQNPLAITLESAGEMTDVVTVTAQRAVQNEVYGVGSAFSAQDIAEQPAIDRDVIKTLLRDPLAQSDGTGNLSVAGVNPRFNTFSIDGATQTDNFGLSSGTYATSRSPINLDAVESATLSVADYSVLASDFVGGQVNVVTKSGTNEFDGSVFYAYKDGDFVGTSFDGGNFDPGEFEEKEYGFTLGGPIIKDKLFFFVSYDEYENAAPVDFTNFDEQNGVQPGFFDAVRDIIQSTYGFDPGTRPQTANVPETSERTLIKLDWNINDDHRLSFTYQNTEEGDTSVDADSFTSAWYDTPLEIEAYTAQLFSNWSNRFSTNLRVNYTEFARGQNCRAGGQFGQISLDFEDTFPDSVAGSPLEGLLTEGVDFVAGCDNFRHANQFDDERLEILATGEYFAGDHVLTFGTEIDQYELFNVFVPFSNGDFIFETVDQLINNNPLGVFYSNVSSNNTSDGAAAWGYDRIGLFIQDRWSITPDFELSYGLRYETISQDDAPVFSQPVFDTYGVRTDNNLDGNDLFMPRVGFLWTPADRTTVSGGFGLYSGGNPEVWVSNAFAAPVFGEFGFMPGSVDLTQVPQEILDAVATGVAQPIDYIDEDFETPSDWKASVRFQQGFDLNIGGMDLGDDYVFSAQYLYTRAKDGFNWVNIAQTELADALPTGVAPDGRPIYADLEDLDIPNLTRLTNNDGAESKTLTLALAKRYDFGFNFDVSYAYTDAEVVSEGTSSRGISNWRALFSADRNNPGTRISPFQQEHSFKFNFGYERNFVSDLMTRVDVFGRLFKGDVWSTSFDITDNNALFGRAGLGEDPFDNNPLYIPTPGGDSSVVFSSDFDVAGFFDYVERNGIPVGEIHDPYSESVDNWNNIWDLRFQQELPGIPGLSRFVGDNRFKLILDIENFANLLNSDWGQFVNGPFFGQAGIVRADLVSAADVAANGIDGASALTGDAPRTTCLQASDCLYRYNDFDNDPTSFTSRSNSVYEIRLTLRYDF